MRFLNGFALLFLSLLCACQPQTNIYRQSAFLMGTLVEIQVAAQDAETAQRAISAALARMQAIEAQMSHYRPESELSKLNQQAGQRPLKVSPALFSLLEHGIRWGQLSQGAFDITIGAVSRLWDFDGENPQLPTARALAEALPLVGYRQIQLDEAESTAYLPKAGMALDLGGIAKGYALDEAVRVLREQGIEHAMVDAGGDLRALGGKAQERPWKIGIRHPRRPKEIIATIPLEDNAVVTSGDYERFFIREGVRYHHILEPDSGQPSGGMVSVTVVAPSAEAADVLSTAVFVLGKEKGLKLVAQQPASEALLITAEGEILTSANFPGRPKLKRLDLSGL